jgi:hypothetical protein
VNRIHPAPNDPCPTFDVAAGEFFDGRQLLIWLGERDAEGLQRLASLIAADQPLVGIPLLASEPSDLQSLQVLGSMFEELLEEATSVPREPL